MSAFGSEWMDGQYGTYLWRVTHDLGPNGDNWSYIDRETLCIVDYRPEHGRGKSSTVGAHIAGPFPTMEAAKAAFLLLYGRGINGHSSK